jgi:Zn-dependent peptidase ImmA (M78 family)
MPQKLLEIAKREGIVIEYWDFRPPLEAVYWSAPGLPPIIGLNKPLAKSTQHLRSVLAEELGHHFTTVGDRIPKTYFNRRQLLEISRAEYRAMKWGALFLIQKKALMHAIHDGKKEKWELAEHFNVTQKLIEFRLKLTDTRTFNIKKRNDFLKNINI